MILALLSAPIFGKEYYLRPKAYLDVDAQKMIYGKVLHVKDDRILAIKNDDGKLKDILDLKDVYLLPGLTDCHTHVFFTQTMKDNGIEAALLREAQLSDEARTTRAKVFLRQYLREGFTSVCDLGNSGIFLDTRLKRKINNDPDYPLFYVSGPGISTDTAQFSTHADKKVVSKEYTLIDQGSDIDQLLSQYVEEKADILKIYLDNSPSPGGVKPGLLKKVLSNPKVSTFKKVTFHVVTADLAKIIETARIESLEHATQPFTDRRIKFMTVTDQDAATLREFQYFNGILYQQQIQRLKKLIRDHARIVFGSDFYFHRDDPLFNRAKYAKKTILAYAEAGMTNMEIIKTMTKNSSLSLKEDHNFGKIIPKAYANLIGFKKNPLDDINALMEEPIVINRGKILR